MNPSHGSGYGSGHNSGSGHPDRHEMVSDCISVEEPGYKDGNRQCFSDDQIGDVCGWVGDPKLQAYCERSQTGLKECARQRGGGRCAAATGNRPPSTKKEYQTPIPGRNHRQDHNPLDYQAPGLELNEATKHGQAPVLLPKPPTPSPRSPAPAEVKSVQDKVKLFLRNPIYVGVGVALLFVCIISLLVCLCCLCREENVSFNDYPPADYFGRQKKRLGNYAIVHTDEQDADSEVALPLTNNAFSAVTEVTSEVYS